MENRTVRGKIPRTGTRKKESRCSVCGGTGIVAYWSEIAYFEDRRSCVTCEAGRKVEERILKIVERVGERHL